MSLRFPLGRLFFAFPLFAALLFAARPAHALGPVDVEVAAVAGYGTAPTNSGGVNPLGVGIGGRAGVGFKGFYGGVSVVDYLGDSSTLDGASYKVHSLLAGVELGYTVDALGLKIRPQLGIGSMSVTTSADLSGIPGLLPGVATQGSATNGYLYLDPRVVLEAKLGILLVGVDAGLICLPSGPSSDASSSSAFDVAFAAHGQVGVAF